MPCGSSSCNIFGHGLHSVWGACDCNSIAASRLATRHKKKAESATCTTQRGAVCHSDGESSANWKAFLQKNEDNREDWHKAEKRTGLTGELPLIDSAAKGGSSFFMFEGIIKPRKFVTQYVEVCADPCDLPFDEEWVVLKSIYFMLSDLHGCLQAMRQAFGALFFRYPYDARATCQERVLRVSTVNRRV